MAHPTSAHSASAATSWPTTANIKPVCMKPPQRSLRGGVSSAPVLGIPLTILRRLRSTESLLPLLSLCLGVWSLLRPAAEFLLNPHDRLAFFRQLLPGLCHREKLIFAGPREASAWRACGTRLRAGGTLRASSLAQPGRCAAAQGSARSRAGVNTSSSRTRARSHSTRVALSVHHSRYGLAADRNRARNRSHARLR